MQKLRTYDKVLDGKWRFHGDERMEFQIRHNRVRCLRSIAGKREWIGTFQIGAYERKHVAAELLEKMGDREKQSLDAWLKAAKTRVLKESIAEFLRLCKTIDDLKDHLDASDVAAIEEGTNQVVPILYMDAQFRLNTDSFPFAVMASPPFPFGPMGEDDRAAPKEKKRGRKGSRRGRR